MKYLMGLMLFAMMSCQQENKPQETKPVKDTTVAMQAEHKFDVSMVDNKKDPACGMPVSAGISDTLHVKEKVYGFCSKECKELYVKNPASYKIELKK